MVREHRVEPVVLVLVDEQRRGSRGGSGARARRAGAERLDAVDGRDDEVEGRQAGLGREAIVAAPCPSSSSRLAGRARRRAYLRRRWRACSSSRCRTSSWWSSTTPRPTPPPTSSRRSTTRASWCSATRRGKASRAPSTSRSTRAQGDWVARLDADDVALPLRLETQLGSARGRSSGSSAARSSSSTPSAAPARPPHAAAPRCAGTALFSSPFFHSERARRPAAARASTSLRYDVDTPRARTTTCGCGCSARRRREHREPLVLYRVHERQATKRRRELQRDFQREVALREIAAVAPELSPRRPRAPGCSGAAEGPRQRRRRVRALLEAFESPPRPRRRGAGGGSAHARAGGRAQARAGARARRSRPMSLSPVRAGQLLAREARRDAREALRGSSRRRRSASASPTSRPSRRRSARSCSTASRSGRSSISASSTPAARSSPAGGRSSPRHRAAFMDGRRIPGRTGRLPPRLPDHGADRARARGLAAGRRRHRRLEHVRRAGVVRVVPRARRPVRAPGREQRRRPAAGWRRAVKGAVVPPFVRGAARVLASGRSPASRCSRAAPIPERVSLVREHGRRRPGSARRRIGCGRGGPSCGPRRATDRGRGRALHRPARAGEGAGHARSRRRRGPTRGSARPRRRRAGAGSARGARALGRPARRCRERPLRARRRAVRRSPTCSRCSRRTSRGAWSSTRRPRAGSRSSSPTAWARTPTCSTRATTECSSRRATRRPRPTRSGGSPPTRSAAALRRALARADARLGLRAEHRELRRGRARVAGAARRLLVDRLLPVGDALPGRCGAPPRARPRQASPAARVAEHAARRPPPRLRRRTARRAPRPRRTSRRCRSGRRRRPASRPRRPRPRRARSSRPPRRARTRRRDDRGPRAGPRSAGSTWTRPASPGSARLR